MKRSTHLLAMTLVGVLFLNLIVPAAGTAPDPLSITSPAIDGAWLTAPVEVKVRIAGASALGLRVELNGVNITHLFRPPAGGVVRAVLAAGHLKQGVNRLEARLGEHRAWRSFRVRSLRPTLPGPAPQASPPPLVPIQTRIISGDGTKASDYAIKVGDVVYPAPALSDGTATGYQVLLLDRATLNWGEPSPVSNQSFPTSSPDQVQQMANAMTSASFTGGTPGCWANGCLLVVQSLLAPGYTNCQKERGNCSGLPGSLFESLGGSAQINYADGTTPNTGYSLITSISPGVTAGAGGGFERLTCNGPGGCGDVASAGGRGAISGFLILDNNRVYTFVSPARATFSTGTGDSPTGNTITIGGSVNNGSYPSATIPAGGGAFQVVVLANDTLQLISNDTFDFDQLYSADQGARTMYQVLTRAAGDENSLVFISSVGTNMGHDKWPVEWAQVAGAVDNLGGTYSVFMGITAQDDYALVGRGSPYRNTGLNKTRGTEASTVVTRVIGRQHVKPLASNLRGVLSLDNRGYFRTRLSNLTSDFNENEEVLLDAVALRLPTPWPKTDTPGRRAAYAWISYQLLNPEAVCGMPLDGRGDVRATYPTLTTGGASTWPAKLVPSCFAYPSGQSFSQDDFDEVRGQLSTEIGYVAAVQSYENEVDNYFNDQQSTVQSIITAVQDQIKAYFELQDSTSVGDGWTQALIEGAEMIASEVVSDQAGPEAGLGLDVAFMGINMATASTNQPNGAPYYQLDSTVGRLSNDAVDAYKAQLITFGGLFDLILSDWGRLQALGQPLASGQIAYKGITAGLALENYERSTWRAVYSRLLGAVFKLDRWTGAAEGKSPGPTLICEKYGPNDLIGTQCGYCQGIYGHVAPETWLAIPTATTGKTPTHGNDQQVYDLFEIVTEPVPCGTKGRSVPGGLLDNLFAPLQPGDSTKLGVYRPYFFLYQNNFQTFINPNCGHGCRVD